MSCSRPRRALLALLAAAPLGACFRPMLAEDTRAAGLRGRILLPDADDRLSYFLRQSLRDRLGETTQPDYALQVTISIEERGLAIAEDNSVTRISVRGVASFSLFRQGQAEAVLSGTVASESAYNSTSSLYATRQLAQDIERRVVTDLGERIARRIFAAADRFDAV